MRWMKSAALSGLCVVALSIPALGSDRAALVQIVNRATVQQTASATPAILNVGSPIQISTAVSGVRGGAVPTGTVVFSLTAPGGTSAAVSSGPLALQSDGTASWTITDAPVGQYTTSAAYAGDGQYQPSTAAASPLVVVMGPADFSLDIPKSLTIKQGATGTVNIIVTPVNGFAGTVTFTCSGAPDQSSCTFANGSVVIPAFTGASKTATPQTQFVASLRVTTTATTVTTVGAFLFLIGLRGFKRKREYQWLIVGIGILCFVVGFTGCAGPNRYVQSNGTPVGSYPLTIVAKSGALTHTNTVTLNVVAQ